MASVKNVWTRMPEPQEPFITKLAVAHVGRSLAITSDEPHPIFATFVEYSVEERADYVIN